MSKKNNIKIEENDPFYHDKYDSEKTAQDLSEKLININDPFVVLVNGKGDSGKTTFMKMWKQELINFGQILLRIID